MHDTWTDKLSDYLDDELSPDERRALDAHLSTCADCAGALDELRQVVETAHGLTARPPAHDLWGGIANRLASAPWSGASRAATPFRARPARRFSFTLPQLAAASLLLAAVSGGLTWTLRGRSDALPHQRATAADNSNTGVGGDVRLSPDAPAIGPPAATVSFADAQYDAAVVDLERALDKGRSRLDTSTVAIVEQNLQIIDRAIAQARQALEADPANSYLSSHLVETRRRKLDLLRRATALTN
jgi:anti-sigma factor RsiW